MYLKEEAENWIEWKYKIFRTIHKAEYLIAITFIIPFVIYKLFPM